MRRIRAWGLAAGIALVAVAVVPSVSSADHSWGGYHWARTANPFTLPLGDNVSPAWDPVLATTSAGWSQSSVLTTSVVAGGGSKCRAKAGRVEVCAAKYGRNGWLGLAQIWISGTHITAGTTKMNDTYFSTAAYNTPAWRNLVMCQEVGHTFGLDHQDEDFDNPNLGTCMDYTNDPSTNEEPNQHDHAELAGIYQHLDTTTTLAAVAKASVGQVDLDTPDTWGKKVHSDKGGKHERFERDLGNGDKVLTEVIWVDDDVLSGKAKPDKGKDAK